MTQHTCILQTTINRLTADYERRCQRHRHRQVITFLLHYIPNVGPLIASVLPIPIVLADDTLVPMAPQLLWIFCYRAIDDW